MAAAAGLMPADHLADSGASSSSEYSGSLGNSKPSCSVQHVLKMLCVKVHVKFESCAVLTKESLLVSAVQRKGTTEAHLSVVVSRRGKFVVRVLVRVRGGLAQAAVGADATLPQAP